MFMAKMKPESKETLEDELKETPEQQAKEQREGTEEHDVASIKKSVDIDIPEEFQREFGNFLKKYCKSKGCLSYMRDKIFAHEDEIRKAEAKKAPAEFNSSEMPPM